MAKKQYFCIVFFMVLDLRLNEKIGLSGDNLSFFLLSVTCLPRKAKEVQPFFFVPHPIHKKDSNWSLFAEKGGFEPPVQLPVRQFSKLLV